MVVDRLGLGMLALGIGGIAWMASMQPQASAPRARAMHLRTCELAPMGGELLRETMRGPFANLDEATGSSEIDVKTMRGSAPIDELTVLRTGIDLDSEPGLGSQHHLELALRVGDHWYMHELGTIGPICTGMGGPVWLETTAAAPELCALGASTMITVRVHETSHGDTSHAWDTLVACSVDETGAPWCTEQAVR